MIGLCIDDSKRPKGIPKDKWVVKGDIYTIIYAKIMPPDEKIAFLLKEIDLSEEETPYQYFYASRFAFTKDSMVELSEMISYCIETNQEVEKLIQEIQSL